MNPFNFNELIERMNKVSKALDAVFAIAWYVILTIFAILSLIYLHFTVFLLFACLMMTPKALDNLAENNPVPLACLILVEICGFVFI